MFAEPCTLWQDEQVILSSRTGMWFSRICLLVIALWQVPQSAISLTAFSWLGPLGECTL